ncbi:MAG: tRNA (adenine-N1)-methyltransferase [Chloroflexi bacterium HGW-Chloroflexi-3]|nr:MAG: tRNA (adenine-N1)-methyltransferase [Chloroflexi bacterium HGW-Chloroflexi-3]
MWNNTAKVASIGDLVQLVGLRHKSYIFNVVEDKELHTHRGIIKHNDLVGLPFGSVVHSHNESPFFMLQPSLSDILLDLKRITQILYPKDIGYILLKMGIGEGQHVVEAGTGSGAMTIALAYSVGKAGKITSYDQKKEFQNLAKKNLSLVGLGERVEFKIRNIEEGFEEKNVDALFLDVMNPYDYIPQVKASVKPGGFFGCLVPTTNQVSRLLHQLRLNQFAFLEVVEVLLRFYKAEPERLRPTDRMVAHTGFLIFGRPLLSELDLVNGKAIGILEN